MRTAYKLQPPGMWRNIPKCVSECCQIMLDKLAVIDTKSIRVQHKNDQLQRSLDGLQDEMAQMPGRIRSKISEEFEGKF